MYAFLENCKDYPGVAVNFDRSDTLSRRRNFVAECNFCLGNIMLPGNLIAHVECYIIIGMSDSVSCQCEIGHLLQRRSQ